MLYSKKTFVTVNWDKNTLSKKDSKQISWILSISESSCFIYLLLLIVYKDQVLNQKTNNKSNFLCKNLNKFAESEFQFLLLSGHDTT